MFGDKWKENTYALTLLRLQETLRIFYVASD